MLHGKPCWFELTTTSGALSKAGDFYGRVLGWTVGDARMEGFTYHIASHDGDMIAGLMEIPVDAAGMPPNWTVYLGVDDCDTAARRIAELGGTVVKPPSDIPGTGRFAIGTDPQGAAFGILEPSPMGHQPASGAFDQQKPGHGNWIELMSSDPAAGFDFYAELFGWQKSFAMDVGDLGSYQLFAHSGTEIGGMIGLMGMPRSAWLPYFGVDSVTAVMDRITEAGGTILKGPQEVPGGAHIALASDPQGAIFSVVGPLTQIP